MNSISVNQFREHLKSYVEEVINSHTPLKVTRRYGDDFVVISADDWEREQETLYVLQNSSLIQQIAESFTTHTKAQGYQPSEEQLDEILDI
jgi:antitoxin YefM